ncbi:MAG: rhomboid family intramembrane serine protease [Clostridiales bacterium]|nr:rhomboid family intramembrane serine protease [Clostridiales bacterium]
MYQDFLRKLTAELSEKQYRIVSYDHNENAAAIFMKDEPPVLYFVSIANFDRIAAERYEEAVSAMMSGTLDKNKPIFNNAVCVNILFSEDLSKAGEFADMRELNRDGNIHNIWWYTDGENLCFGKGQPNKIYGIEGCVKDACLKNSSVDNRADDGRTLAEINSDISNSTKLKPKTKYPIVTMVICAVNILIFMAQTVLGSENSFILSFGINNRLIFGYGQYYRLFTYMFIHSGLEHIAFNSVSLYIYGSRVEKYCGRMSTAVIYIFSGIIGGLVSAYFNDGYAVGASGAIFGLLAAMLVVAKRSGQKVDGLSYMTVLIVAVIGIGMGSLEAGVDNYGHIGGFIGGLISGALVSGLSRNKKE